MLSATALHVIHRYRIETVNHPLPRTVTTKINQDVEAALHTSFVFAFLVGFGMSFLVGTYVVFVVNERSVKAKHAQFVSGVGVTNFWLAAFLWDAVCYLVPAVLIIIVIEAFQSQGYSYNGNAGLVG